jgi:hypothetical protein
MKNGINSFAIKMYVGGLAFAAVLALVGMFLIGTLVGGR